MKTTCNLDYARLPHSTKLHRADDNAKRFTVSLEAALVGLFVIFVLGIVVGTDITERAMTRIGIAETMEQTR